MNDKILTVVVPTYNAENYLRDNLNAFIYEDILPDVEILIINDGSKDKSLDIAMEYVQRYPDSFNVITKENGGHGSGINCGIQNATGKYFKVVDADDWIEADAFRKLLQSLKRMDADVIYSGFLWVFNQGQGDKNLFRKKAEISQPFIGVLYEHNYDFDEIADKLYMKMHNMTIKTDILRKHHILIDENCYYVDTEYITYPIPYVKTISFVHEFVYMYRIGRQGQSVGIEKMQQNETNYDKVLRSLFDFYLQLGREIPCSYEKKRYIERIIARVVAGKIKIMLSFPATRGKKKELQTFDDKLKKNYPNIYDENINKAIAILRKSRYFLYYPISFAVRRKFS